jgi:hypothetical protein
MDCRLQGKASGVQSGNGRGAGRQPVGGPTRRRVRPRIPRGSSRGNAGPGRPRGPEPTGNTRVPAAGGPACRWAEEWGVPDGLHEESKGAAEETGPEWRISNRTSGFRTWGNVKTR